MKFSEMPYKRVDIQELEASYKELIERAKNAKSGEELFTNGRSLMDFWRWAYSDILSNSESLFNFISVILFESRWNNK